MSTSISFNVPGRPVAKGRARSKAIRTGKAEFQITRKKWKTLHYTPEATATYEEKVKVYAIKAMGARKPFTGAIELYVTFVFLHPKSHYRTGKFKGQLKPQYVDKLPQLVKPDVSNTIKSIEDACNGIVWKDDCLIWFLLARKIYGERESVDVTITEEKWLTTETSGLLSF